ncbi:MAG: prolyl aminopeptidase [Bdellovibrionales bacterium]
MTYSTYPITEPYNTGRLKVSSLHELYYEEVGNPKGAPIVFLHGGPGGGVAPKYRQFFDPRHYRVILFDQRGAGLSTPYADLRENTTWDLVADIEKLRTHLKIDQWIVFGGSWGSTLALAYAETHPTSVKGLVLRGIFLCRKKEIDWFYQDGASKIFPDFWDHYLAAIPESERHDLVTAYHKRLTHPDKKIQLEAARAWSIWEGSTSMLFPSDDLIGRFAGDEFALAFARIECHYFVNRAFFPTDNYLIENVHKIRHIPAEIVHGRYDVVCPIENAWELHRAWPESLLHMIPDCGHSALEPGISRKLVEVTERFKNLG